MCRLNARCNKKSWLTVLVGSLIGPAVLFVSATVLAEQAPESGHGGEGLASIAKLSRDGRHFEALSKLEMVNPAELTLAEKIAGARSAWALGLVDRARIMWDEILADPGFQSGPERYRILLSRAILELQERNYEKARAIAETAAFEITDSTQRAHFWFAIAEALREQGAFSNAEMYYKKAIAEGDRELRLEATYMLGETQLKLGMLSEARLNFASIETGSTFAIQALRRLAEIDFKQRKWEGVLTWIEEGRASFPGDFEDAWIRYAQVCALVEDGQLVEAEAELKQFSVRYSEQDRWVMLARALFEGKTAQQMLAKAALKEP